MERLFNMCRNHGIECWHMYYENGCCYACLYVEDFWKIRKFIRKTRVRIHIEKRCGLAFFINYLKKRKGMLIGFCGCFFVLFLLSLRIWKIEYEGNSYYTDERLTKYLIEKENFYYGIQKDKLSGAILEENLRLAFPEISWVSVRIEGTSLIVNLEEMVKYEIKSKDKKTRYICSDEDGTVVRMVTRSGTPKVTLGEEIHSGDLLIDGSISIMNDAMEVVEERIVGADGDVYAEVADFYEKTYYFEKKSEKYGRASYILSVSIGDWEWRFDGFSKSREKQQSYQHVTEVWAPVSGIFLQLDTFKPIEQIFTLDAPEMAKKQAEEEMSDIFREFNEKGVQILENNVKIFMYENRVEAKGDLRLIKPVGKAMERLPDSSEIVENGETDEHNRNDD